MVAIDFVGVWNWRDVLNSNVDPGTLLRGVAPKMHSVSFSETLAA
jgi:hypothetical protein